MTTTNNSRNIYIVGAGGFGREVLCLINRVNQNAQRLVWCVKGFVDYSSKETIVANLPVITDDNLLDMTEPVNVALAVGNPSIRSKIIGRYKEAGHIRFPNLIDPKALIMDETSVSFGHGNIICARTVFTTDIRIGDYNIFNLSCTVGHDVFIGNNNIVNPSVNISGEVTIGNSCLIGTGAQVLQQLSIGNHVAVGAGAVIVKNTGSDVTVVGVPANPLQKP